MIRQTIGTVESLLKLLTKPTKENMTAILALVEELADKLGRDGATQLRNELRRLVLGDRDIWARTLAALIRDQHLNLYERFKPLSPFADDVTVVCLPEDGGGRIVRGDTEAFLDLVGRSADIWRLPCRNGLFLALRPADESANQGDET